ncbi:FmdB family zinc ribbon protein [Halarsenatibacter silvermanii]|uniref:Putative regulatory protein, FmdB family n=1 Tax=Halarsenatibacter silvermanii TaxID=321763 RepID=A0A1G9PT01_9FIRM|nr:zinc ribbon domain-containing protein [Halarsenatibacter silvermanii]SDM01849.1 putative regulatory protein, FmdB family [Halarsenatibacter silvermanii]
MPSYNFVCKDCDEEFTIEASMEERDSMEINCPECGSENVKQTFGSIGLLSCSTSGAAGSPG